jgi:hypothetical protein
MVARYVPAQGLPRLLALGGAVLAAALAAYLLLPILTPVHVEGFTGSIASLAQHLRQDSLDNFDRHQPIYTEFFGLSKLGWILLTAAVSSLFHISTTAAMALIVWIAAPAFAVGTAFLVRRWTGAPFLLIAFILILFPAVSESAFFFNDNLPASALAVGGMCALYMRRQLAGAALCGALFGAAVLTRTDTAIVGAVVPIIILERPGSVRSRLLALAMAGAAGAAVFLGTLAIFRSTPFDILNVAGAMIKAWNHPTITERVVLLTIYFLGPAGYVLTLGGFIPLIRRRDLWCAARLLLTPAAYFCILWAQLWEIRQLLPLTPFLASLAALALRALVAQPRTRAATLMQGGLIALLLLSLFGPITRPVFKDGPRVLFGRVANIGYWREWQANVGDDLRLIKTLANVPPGATRVVLTDGWTEDRYAHLAFQDAGYRIAPMPDGACANLAERFTAPGRQIYLARSNDTGEQLRTWAARCIAEARPSDVLFVAPEPRLALLLGSASAADKANAVMARDQTSHWPLRAIKTDAAQLQRILQGYDEDMQDFRARGVKVVSASELLQASRKRTHFGF